MSAWSLSRSSSKRFLICLELLGAALVLLERARLLLEVGVEVRDVDARGLELLLELLDPRAASSSSPWPSCSAPARRRAGSSGSRSRGASPASRLRSSRSRARPSPRGARPSSSHDAERRTNIPFAPDARAPRAGHGGAATRRDRSEARGASHRPRRACARWLRRQSAPAPFAATSQTHDSRRTGAEAASRSARHVNRNHVVRFESGRLHTALLRRSPSQRLRSSFPEHTGCVSLGPARFSLTITMRGNIRRATSVASVAPVAQRTSAMSRRGGESGGFPDGC